MQSVIAVVFIGMMVVQKIPFNECILKVAIPENRTIVLSNQLFTKNVYSYQVVGKTADECFQ